jgi:hypothetical protein
MLNQSLRFVEFLENEDERESLAPFAVLAGRWLSCCCCELWLYRCRLSQWSVRRMSARIKRGRGKLPASARDSRKRRQGREGDGRVAARNFGVLSPPIGGNQNPRKVKKN